jgi:hypothetical protein
VRRTYLLTVRVALGVDDVRALRAWLKIGLRTFGLRCVGITPKKEEKAMDARKYASKYVKPDNVRDGPIETRIVNVFEEEKYGRLALELEIGSQFSLNDGNCNTLIKAWGHDTDLWIGSHWRWSSANTLIGARTRRSKKKPSECAPSRRRRTQNGSVTASRPLPPSRTAPSKDDLDDEIPF